VNGECILHMSTSQELVPFHTTNLDFLVGLGVPWAHYGHTDTYNHKQGIRNGGDRPHGWLTPR